jgi:elongator complex protein 3
MEKKDTLSSSCSSPSVFAFEVVRSAQKMRIRSKQELTKIKNSVCRRFGVNTFPDTELLSAYRILVTKGEIEPSSLLEFCFQKRSIRTLSGIAPISVLMKPLPCKSACVYCPSERADEHGKTLFQKDTERKYGKQNILKKYQKPGALVMPKSYLSNEPGAMRALLAGFDPRVQIFRRISALEKTGHSAEKCELIVQGGTFSDIPKQIRTRFITQCYKAFNEYDILSLQKNKGCIEKISLEETKPQFLSSVQKENESAKHRVVGLTLETRPGSVTPQEVQEFRKLGCTRVEIGVQTLDDEITKKTRRYQTREEVKQATFLLRQSGFKICYHVMPNLPFSSPEKDLEVYREICQNPDFCPDIVKIYPCTVVPFSELEQWYKKGKYTPYSDEILFQLLREMKKITPPWMRITRLVRDIPGTAILGGSKRTNLRQLIREQMQKEGERCRCIRCREIRNSSYDFREVRLSVRTYDAGGGTEYFLSHELPDMTLLSLLRLRIPGEESPPFRALKKAGIIRELHSFGHALGIGEKRSSAAQHVGFGKLLIREAEKIVRNRGLKKLAVISGIGVKHFYRKLGFSDDGTYLVKHCP